MHRFRCYGYVLLGGELGVFKHKRIATLTRTGTNMSRNFELKIVPNILFLTLLCLYSFASLASGQERWRGLVVESEYRCSPYDKKKQYPYPQSVEDGIVNQMTGRVYGPYTGRYFVDDTETDIEHIVAASEGHDSGLCEASPEERASFATDLLNLTLAAPEINRCGRQGKCGFDAAEWMPNKNKCWFAARVVEVKKKYSLSVDQAEADALEAVLSVCESHEMIFYPMDNWSAEESVVTEFNSTLAKYDDNNNGRISCAEARSYGIAPVMSGQAAYVFMNDLDGDGVVCE